MDKKLGFRKRGGHGELLFKTIDDADDSGLERNDIADYYCVASRWQCVFSGTSWHPESRKHYYASRHSYRLRDDAVYPDRVLMRVYRDGYPDGMRGSDLYRLDCGRYAIRHLHDDRLLPREVFEEKNMAWMQVVRDMHTENHRLRYRVEKACANRKTLATRLFSTLQDAQGIGLSPYNVVQVSINGGMQMAYASKRELDIVPTDDNRVAYLLCHDLVMPDGRHGTCSYTLSRLPNGDIGLWYGEPSGAGHVRHLFCNALTAMEYLEYLQYQIVLMQLPG